MTSISIPLVPGKNYISFPALSPYSFRTIFTDSNIINDIGIDQNQNKMFYGYDPIIDGYTLVDLDLEYIERGKGYYLYISSTNSNNISIIYDGIEYMMSFEEFKSKIVKGWNLLGIGKDDIVPLSYCKILDPLTLTEASILRSKHSYLVNYDECIESTTGYGGMITVVASTLVAIAIMKQFKWI